MPQTQPPIQVDINDIIPSNIQNQSRQKPNESLYTQDGLKQDPSSLFIECQTTQQLPVSECSPDQPNPMDQTKLQINDPIQDLNLQKQPQAKQIEPEKHSSCGRIKRNKLIIIGIIVGCLVLISMAVFCAIYFSRQKFPHGPTFVFNCENYPDDCKGVTETVKDYVAQTYTDPDQAQSILQAARALNSLPKKLSTEIPRQNLTDIFRDIARSVECMYFNMPENYMGAFERVSELQLTTETEIEAYLQMLESFSGQPLKLTNSFELEQTCKFNISESRRRRLLQEVPAPSAGNACVTNASSLMIYFSGIGYSPSSIVQTIYKTQLILLGNSNTSYDAGIVALGAWRSDGNLGFHSNLVTSYESYLKQTNSTVPTLREIYSALRVILNACRSREVLPSELFTALIKNLLPFFIEQSLLSFINNQDQYELEKHKDFVVQQLAEGKRITFAAHAEGAYYASKVYNLLSEAQKRYVSLVYIAPMVSSMPDGSLSYITNPNDLMVEAIRTLSLKNSIIPNPLPANAEAANFSSQVDIGLNHELTGYAMAYKDKLLQTIITAMFRTIQPPQQMGNGPITITLTWESDSDVDLHVLEPSGNHVYFGYKNGGSGFLDMDKTYCCGPEHYYTNCNLQTGNYTVYLHLYRGYGPVKTTTTVMAGSQYLLREHTPYSNQNVDVCVINVAYNNSTRSYSYTIYPS